MQNDIRIMTLMLIMVKLPADIGQTASNKKGCLQAASLCLCVV